MVVGQSVGVNVIGGVSYVGIVAVVVGNAAVVVMYIVNFGCFGLGAVRNAVVWGLVRGSISGGYEVIGVVTIYVGSGRGGQVDLGGV